MNKFGSYRLLWQILFWWGTFFLLSVFLSNGLDKPEIFAKRGIAILLGIIVVISVNVKLLFPYFYLRKRTGFFVVASIGLLALTVFLLHSEIFPWADLFKHVPRRPMLDNLTQDWSGSERTRRFFSGLWWVGRTIPFLLAFLGSTIFEIALFANKKEKEAVQSEKEKLETELKFLKSQVNPHFLFNALNNIYSLSVMQAPQTSESIMQLSEMLRYMVYDTKEEKVPLKNEINYIENYIELKRLKDSRGLNVELQLDVSVPEVLIEPLLFIPFVENAFKHSKIEDLRKGYVKIELKVEPDVLVFTVKNSVPENTYTKDKVGGVGLTNIQKRLDLLYPDELHQLEINQETDHFETKLKLFGRWTN